jgi:pilus assembly protein CpaB
VKRRVLTVSLAILLAVLGTAGVLAYVHQADARAVAGMKAVTVLVARHRVPSGTSAGAALAGGLLASQTLPASSVPADAVRSLTPATTGLVTSADIQPGQLVLRPMLVTAAMVRGGLAVPAGDVAVTIALCMPEAVAGNVVAGSQVEVFGTDAHAATLTAQPNCNGPHQQQAPGSAHTRVVLPRALVLSVGPAGSSTGSTTATAQTTTSASGQANVLVTLAVTQADAQRLIQLTEAGLPYLALLK